MFYLMKKFGVVKECVVKFVDIVSVIVMKYLLLLVFVYVIILIELCF